MIGKSIGRSEWGWRRFWDAESISRIAKGKCEQDWHLGGGENGMAIGDGGSRQRTERPEK